MQQHEQDVEFPKEVPLDFIPLGEFWTAYLAAKEFGLTAFAGKIRWYIERRVRELTVRLGDGP